MSRSDFRRISSRLRVLAGALDRIAAEIEKANGKRTVTDRELEKMDQYAQRLREDIRAILDRTEVR